MPALPWGLARFYPLAGNDTMALDAAAALSAPA